MLKKTALRGMLAACLLLCVATMSLFAQGVPRQDYSGLDKYLPQGRDPDQSFAGVRAAEFLTIPVGARGIGMGSAYTAVANDISSIWWNPAGLGFIENREVMLNVVDYTMDLTYSYAAFAMPLGDGNVVVGGFLGYLDIPDMEITTITSPDGTGSLFTAYDFQMGGSVAYNLSDRFVAGINLKYVHQDVYNNIGGSAFAVDAGAIYHTQFMDREIKFSFAIQNLGTNITMSGSNMLYMVGPEDRYGNFPDGYRDPADHTHAVSRKSPRQMTLRTHTYRLPSTVKMALAYNLYTGEKANWLAAAEVWRPAYIPMAYAIGTEVTYNFNPVISGALRMGWQIQTDEISDDTDGIEYSFSQKDQLDHTYYGDDPTFRGLSFGGGLQRSFGGKFIRFNYAYKNKGRLTADNFFTLTLGF
ncbi:MAG: PorV/PorQ family protein [Gemmatimonadota bacterium]|nr:PorV/PorQ family protein [Gemmatimonadota bacterium]